MKNGMGLRLGGGCGCTHLVIAGVVARRADHAKRVPTFTRDRLARQFDARSRSQQRGLVRVLVNEHIVLVFLGYLVARLSVRTVQFFEFQNIPLLVKDTQFVLRCIPRGDPGAAFGKAGSEHF